MTKKILVLITLLFGLQQIFGQNNNFNFYFFENRYSPTELKFINSQQNFKMYNLFSQGYLESTTNKGHIDLVKVQRSVIANYPSSNASGYLVLDFEGLIYQNLQNYHSSHYLFKSASKEFIDMVRLVKILRPNLKVGIYGLPFKFYFENQRKYNEGNKFDLILKETDFIAPSLYVLYSEKEKNSKLNEKFLKENLQVFLDTGKRLNKPVIPFFWYMVNPVNKTYGHEIISKDKLKTQLNIVKNYSIDGKQTDGVFWWDISERYFTKYMNEAKKGKRRQHLIKSKMDLFKYYQLEK